MNKVILIGRLARDPEMRTTATGTTVTRFTIAVSRPFTAQNGERGTDFINCIAWRRQAENIAKYCTKGSQVALEGRIQTGSYDGTDGTKRYTTDIIADNVTFLGTKGNNENNSFSSNDPFPQEIPAYQDSYATSSAPTANIGEDPFKDFGSEIALSDDDLPF
ncbi:MAG: single-stranded DNA-binding protein [Bacilli bacterium]|jgi:single-strand DNA-binding protein|nr:single-stranded DNA-binding protein [Bacilli bacterium]